MSGTVVRPWAKRSSSARWSPSQGGVDFERYRGDQQREAAYLLDCDLLQREGWIVDRRMMLHERAQISFETRRKRPAVVSGYGRRTLESGVRGAGPAQGVEFGARPSMGAAPPVDLVELYRRARERARLCSPRSQQDPLVVIGSRPPGPRKGFDLFLQLAVAVRRRVGRDDRVLLRWVGVEPPGIAYRKARDEVARAGLDHLVDLVPATPDRLEIFASADVLAFTSREDPYPLVVLAAAALGVPMVCFAGSGGGPDFAAQGAGLVVPYLDVEAMAEAILALKEDPQRRAELAARGREVVERAHDLPVVAGRMQVILRAVLGGASPTRPQRVAGGCG